MKLGLRDFIDSREIVWTGCTAVVIFFSVYFSGVGFMVSAFLSEGGAGSAESTESICTSYSSYVAVGKMS